MLAGSVATEARCPRSLTPETAAPLLALSGWLVAILTYQGVDPSESFIRGLFAQARELGCAEEWRLAVCDAVTALIGWRLQD